MPRAPSPPPEEALLIKGNINRLLGERRMSAATVANLAGIPHTTWYRRMEKPRSFTLGELLDLAAALRVDLKDLVG